MLQIEEKYALAAAGSNWYKSSGNQQQYV